MPGCGSGAVVLPWSSPRSQHHAAVARKIHLSWLFRFLEPPLADNLTAGSCWELPSAGWSADGNFGLIPWRTAELSKYRRRSATNVKARLPWRVGRGDADIFDLRRRRSFAQRRDQRLDSIAVPRHHRLHRSVWPISDPSRDAELLCLRARPCSERDTLHAAHYIDMSCSHGLACFVIGEISPSMEPYDIMGFTPSRQSFCAERTDPSASRCLGISVRGACRGDLSAKVSLGQSFPEACRSVRRPPPSRAPARTRRLPLHRASSDNSPARPSSAHRR